MPSLAVIKQFGTGNDASFAFKFEMKSNATVHTRVPIIVAIGSQNPSQSVLIPITITGSGAIGTPKSMPGVTSIVSNTAFHFTINVENANRHAIIAMVYSSSYISDISKIEVAIPI